MEKSTKSLSKDEILELESQAIESYMKGDKPYRKVLRPSIRLINCHDCKSRNGLILITLEKESSFKKLTHKKNRNRIPLLDNNGNKVYLCKSCLIKRAKKAQEK